MAPGTRRRTGGIALALVLVPLVLAGTLLAGLAATLFGTPEEETAPCVPAYEPSRVARSSVPRDYLRLYRAAATEYGVGWEYLAAIGSVESGHGRSSARGVRSGTNAAGAAGPMQFLLSTWRVSGLDGDGDGRKDPYDPADAIPAAAGYLRAGGAPEDYGRALFSYNHAGWYVADVERLAARYRGGDFEVADTGCAATLALGRASGRDVVGDPRIVVYPGGQADLLAGRVDARVTGLLETLGRSHTLTVSSLVSGHSIFAASGNRSNHADGRAVDIAVVDGEPCTGTRTGACGRLAVAIGRLTGPAAPTELIYAFDPDGPGGAGFARPSDHSDHVHVGWDR